MPLGLADQLGIIRNTLSKADFGLLVRAIRDPHLLTPSEAGTVGDSLGMAQGWKKWVMNLATDPTVWIATLLAARFPVSLWSHGIPKRLIGVGNEFGGLSKIFRPVVQAFRGTGTEERIALGMHRQAGYMMKAQDGYRALGVLSKQEQVALVRFREEGIKDGLTPNVLRANTEITKLFQETWSMLKNVSDVQGSPSQNVISWGGWAKRSGKAMIEDPRVPRDFASLIPHIPITSTEGTMTLSGAEALTRLTARGGKALEASLKSQGFRVARRVPMVMPDGSKHPTRTVVVELGPWRVNDADQIVTATGKFQQMMTGTTGKLFFSHLGHRTRDLTIHGTGKGKFVVDVNQIFAHYIRGASRTYAWNSPLTAQEQKIGAYLVENPNPKERVGRFFKDRMITQELGPEPLMIQIQKGALESMGVKMEKSVVTGTEGWITPRHQFTFQMGDTPAKLQALEHLTNSLKGSFNDKAVIFGSMFSSIATQLERVATATGAGKALGAVSPGAVKQLVTHFEYLKTNASDRSINNFLATYSYYTTLGGNIGSALGNSLQTPLTTIPSLPFGAVMEGIGEFLGKIPKYTAQVAKNYRNSGKDGPRSLTQSARDAFTTVYRELADYKIDIDPRAFDVDEDLLVAGAAGLGQVFKTAQKYMDWLLIPFKTVETANRGIAFYAARRSGIRMMKANPYLKPKGLTEEGLLEYINIHAAKTVNATQFIPGGGSRTIWQDGVAPWLRTFTSFPTRFLSWAAESTTRGAMTEAEMKTAGLLDKLLNGRNVGTLARLYVSGSILKSGFRDVLGLDVNRWVGFGPLNMDQDLAIFPIPPLAGVVFNAFKYLESGDIDDTQPITLPGIGKIPIPRVLIPGGVALNRLGRAIEMFDSDAGGFVDEDQRLMRRAGAKDQIMTMLGIPSHKARRERLQMASLRVRVQKIRDYRRKFGMAIIQGDMRTAAEAAARYSKAFPGMPKLNLAVHDLNTLHKNARIPRLSHRLKGIGDQEDYLRADLLSIDPTMVLGPDQFPGVPGF